MFEGYFNLRHCFVATDRKEAIKIAWVHGGPDFQSRFEKSTAQAEEMKAGGAAGSVKHGRFVDYTSNSASRGAHLDCK